MNKSSSRSSGSVLKHTAVVVAIVSAIGLVAAAWLKSRGPKEGDAKGGQSVNQQGSGNQYVAQAGSTMNVGQPSGTAKTPVELRITSFRFVLDPCCDTAHGNTFITNLSTRTTPVFEFKKASQVRIGFYFHIAGYATVPSSENTDIDVKASMEASDGTALATASLGKIDSIVRWTSGETARRFEPFRVAESTGTAFPAKHGDPILFFGVVDDFKEGQLPKGEGFLRIIITDNLAKSSTFQKHSIRLDSR